MRAPRHGSMRAHVALAFAALVLAGDALQPALAGGCGFDYKDALSKTIIFLEAQRSGKLPRSNRARRPRRAARRHAVIYPHACVCVPLFRFFPDMI
ncbi:Endoglucanase 15 [Zea mays]|uniref:Endoglucanase 15 n=1 Tax=Zea mays TaxID=4577 RepID=A0A1D6HM45_MAIZE|nr:Endoglucanase 15 [Zea mays]